MELRAMTPPLPNEARARGWSGSMSTTLRPCCCSSRADESPTAPAPMTAMSQDCSAFGVGADMISLGLGFVEKERHRQGVERVFDELRIHDAARHVAQVLLRHVDAVKGQAAREQADGKD